MLEVKRRPKPQPTPTFGNFPQWTAYHTEEIHSRHKVFRVSDRIIGCTEGDKPPVFQKNHHPANKELFQQQLYPFNVKTHKKNCDFSRSDRAKTFQLLGWADHLDSGATQEMVAQSPQRPSNTFAKSNTHERCAALNEEFAGFRWFNKVSLHNCTQEGGFTTSTLNVHTESPEDYPDDLQETQRADS